MKFHNQHQAKQFFIDKVIAQALRSNTPFSEAERYMLEWTEVEEGFVVEQDMVDMYYAETTDEEFETKVKGLLADAYDFDTTGNQKMVETYRNAYNALKKHDHYIMVMIDQAIGRYLEKSGSGFIQDEPDTSSIKRFPAILDKSLLVITALCCSVVFFAYVYILYNKWYSTERTVFVFGCITYIIAFNFFTREAKMKSVLSFFREKGSSLPLVTHLLFNIVPVLLTGAVFYFKLVKLPGLDKSYVPREEETLIGIYMLSGPGLGYIAAYYYKDFLERIVYKSKESH